MELWCGGGKGNPTHDTIYAMKLLYIWLDKVYCPTLSFAIHKSQVNSTIPFTNGKTVLKKDMKIIYFSEQVLDQLLLVVLKLSQQMQFQGITLIITLVMVILISLLLLQLFGVIFFMVYTVTIM